MKKFKKFAALSLAILMGGVVGVSAGCGTSAEEEAKKQAALVAEKKEAYTDLSTSVQTMMTSGKVYQLSLDFSAITTDIEQDGADTFVYKTKMDADGDLYFQISETAVSVDAVLRGVQVYNPDTETAMSQYGYAAAYIRSNDIYASKTTSSEPITDALIDGLAYDKTTATALWAMLQEYMGSMGDMGTSNTVVAVAEEVAPETQIPADVAAIIEKLATNAMANVSGSVKTSGGVTTITVDWKAELSSVYNVTKVLFNSINASTTLKQLITNKSFAGLFNKYLGSLSAEELIILAEYAMTASDADISLVLPEAQTGEKAYDYIVRLLAEIPMGTKTLGDMPVGDIKEDVAEALVEIKEALDTINSLKYSISLTKDMFCGFTVDVDIANEIDLDISVVLQEVTYTFKDVSTLTIPVDDPEV